MSPNPSAESFYCKEYFLQRKSNKKLVKTQPYPVTRLILQNGTRVLCWEDMEMKDNYTVFGKYGWCKRELVSISLYIVTKGASI